MRAPSTAVASATAVVLLLLLQNASVTRAAIVNAATTTTAASAAAAASFGFGADDQLAATSVESTLGPSSPTAAATACPDKCTCKVAALDGGLKVKCGGTPLLRLASLKEIDFGAMRADVQQLDLSRNLLLTLDAADFGNFTSLRKLDLSGNALSSIEGRVFRQLGVLEKLKLAGNGIVHVFQGAFDGMVQLKQM